MSTPPGFTGIPVDAVDFYDELGHHNDRGWWAANKDRYATSVREPVLALADALADEFGEMKVFRPHRDVRYSTDKTPYKDRQGALAQVSDGMGYYVSVGPEGLTTGGGSMHLTPDQLARFRAAIDAPASGIALEKLVDALRRKGFGIGGEMLKSRPRGVDPDHPRLALLRHKSLIVWRDHGVPDWMPTPGVTAKVRAEWRLVRPTIAWLEDHVGASTAPRTGRG